MYAAGATVARVVGEFRHRGMILWENSLSGKSGKSGKGSGAEAIDSLV